MSINANITVLPAYSVLNATSLTNMFAFNYHAFFREIAIAMSQNAYINNNTFRIFANMSFASLDSDWYYNVPQLSVVRFYPFLIHLSFINEAQPLQLWWKWVFEL
jgi:hypothetical protein